MKNVLVAAALTLVTSTSFATGFAPNSSRPITLSICNGSYLAMTGTQSASRIADILKQAVSKKVLIVSSYNPHIGMYAVTGKGATAQEALEIMEFIKNLPGASVECDQQLSQQGFAL